MAEETRLLQSMRVPGRMFDLVQGDHVSTHYVDGSAGAAIGPAVSRIDFFTIKGLDIEPGREPIEKREKSLTIILPTAAFIEFVIASLMNLKNSERPISDALKKQAEALVESLSSITLTQTPTAEASNDL